MVVKGKKGIRVETMAAVARRVATAGEFRLAYLPADGRLQN